MPPDPPSHADADALRALVARYCMAVDDGRFDDFEALWAPDARLHVMGSTHTGPAAIRSFIEAAQGPEARGRHTTSSHLFASDSPHEVRGWVDYVFFDAGGTATNIGRYHDRYVLDTGGRWRFGLREIVFRGAAPELTDRPT